MSPKFIRSIVLFTLIILSFNFIPFVEASRSPRDVPNPNTHPHECGRKDVSQSSICNPDDIIEKESCDVIEGLINAVTKAQIAVVVISGKS
jgi:hypothetical protein